MCFAAQDPYMLWVQTTSRFQNVKTHLLFKFHALFDFPDQDAPLDDQLPDIPANDTIAAPQQTGPYLTLDPPRQVYDGLQPQAEAAYMEPGVPICFPAGQVYDEIDENRDMDL